VQANSAASPWVPASSSIDNTGEADSARSRCNALVDFRKRKPYREEHEEFAMGTKRANNSLLCRFFVSFAAGCFNPNGAVINLFP
jgi:hypothetical protein